MDRGRRIIDNVFENEEQNFSNLAVEISGKSINGGVAKMLLENCEARLIQYQPGTIIPRHAHTDEVYKFILRGRMETEDEIQLTTGIGDYKCGGHEYGPWKVLDLTMSCPLLSGPSTMTVWIEEGTTNASEEAQARGDHWQAA